LENDPLLSDLVADSEDEMSAITLGTGFTLKMKLASKRIDQLKETA